MYSRVARQLWHDAPGMFRDVDSRSCYSTILGRLYLYLGRPIVWEPGARRLKLEDAIAWIRRYADEDAWFIGATGDIKAIANTLVPSTNDAITTDNYRRRSRRDADRQPTEPTRTADSAQGSTRPESSQASSPLPHGR